MQTGVCARLSGHDQGEKRLGQLYVSRDYWPRCFGLVSPTGLRILGFLVLTAVTYMPWFGSQVPFSPCVLGKITEPFYFSEEMGTI